MQWYVKALREYATFDGRARRTEFWMFVLFSSLFGLAALVLDGIVSMMAGVPLPIFVVVYWLVMIVPSLAVTVRRLHDTDRSGWWYFIQLVPFGGIVLLVFACTEGTPGPNAYGPSPKAVPANHAPTYAGPTHPGPTYA